MGQPLSRMGRWDAAPNFLGHAGKAVSVNRPVLRTCRSGGRPVEAGCYPEKYGFPELSSVDHGFECDVDELQHRNLKNGGRIDSLPWE